MYCQKCGRENSDDAVFCNSCDASLTKKSTPNAAYIQLKQNEIRLLQETFNHENSYLWQDILKIVGVILAVIFFFIAGPLTIGCEMGISIFLIANGWIFIKSKAAKKIEIELKAAKAELEKVKNA